MHYIAIMIRLTRRFSEVAFILKHSMILTFPFSSLCVVNTHLSLLPFIHTFSHCDICLKLESFSIPLPPQYSIPPKFHLNVLHLQLLFFTEWRPSPTEQLCPLLQRKFPRTALAHRFSGGAPGNTVMCRELQSPFIPDASHHLRCNSKKKSP